MKTAAFTLLALLAGIAHGAGDFSALPQYLPAGQWRLDYDRQAKIRLLHYRKADHGSRDTCIGADPRNMILDWLADKNCQIEQDTLFGKSWRLQGSCRVKWTREPIPVEIEILLADGATFVMNTRTPQGGFLEFQEHATATRVGATCKAKRAD